MSDTVILLIISVVAIALMAALPQICCPIYLAIVMMFVMNEGSLLVKFGLLFPAASVLFIGLMASPLSGSLLTVLRADVPNKPARFGAHIAAMLCLTYGGFLAMVRWAVSVHENPSFPKILLVLGVSLLVGFVLATAGSLLTDTLFVSKEEEVKKAREEAEQARLAAEQARLAAEQAAKIEAERQRIAAEQAAKQRQTEAEAEARRLEQEAAVAAERERVKANKQAVLDFWDILVRDYCVSSRLRKIAIGSANFIEPLNQDVPEIWVKNDERIAAIEKILQAAGFYYTQGEREPAYPYESPLLEKVLYASDPLETNVKDVTRKKIRAYDRGISSAYVSGLSSKINDVTSWANQVIQECFEDYKKEYGIMKSGLKGEYAVQEILEMHAGSFIVLHDLRLEFPGKGKKESVETDTLILAPNGIFAVEVKNYGESGRYKIVVTSDGSWYMEYPPKWEDDTAKREPMANPFAQNDRHIAFLEKFINELLGRDMSNWAHVENIICVANDTVELENDPGAKQTLTRVSNLYNHITYDRTQRFSIDELSRIKEALEARALPGKAYPLADYTENLKIAVGCYRQATSSWITVITEAERCLQDHPEFRSAIK